MKKNSNNNYFIGIDLFYSDRNLKGAKICPEYFNLMSGPDKSNTTAWQVLFYPFTEKVY